MVENLMQGFQGILLICILLGLLMGLWRGFNKSLIRFFVVIAMSLVCFFITPPISKAIVDADISSLNFSIDGVKMTTIKEGLVALLEKINFISELMTASDTFRAFVEALPALVINLLVFMLGFLILSIISNLFSWLLSKLILRRIPKGSRNRHRLLGGLVGAIQGVFVFAVLAVPVFGLVGTAEKALNATNDTKTQTASYQTQVNKDDQVYTLVSVESSDTTEQDSSKKSLDTEEYNKYIKDFNKLPFVKVFKALGIKSVEQKVYNSLTTTSINKEKVSLEKEVVTIAKAANNISSITKLSASSTAEDFDNARDVVSTLFDSSLFSRIGEEVVRHAATEWSDPSDPKAFGVKKPDIGKMGNPLLDKALLELQNATRKTLEADLIQTLNLLECAKDNGLFKAFTDKSSSEDLLRLFSKNDGQVIVDLVDNMLPSKTLQAVLPQMIQTGLDTMYPTLGIPENDTEKETTVLQELCDIVADVRSADFSSPELATADLSNRLEQNMSKNMFNFDGVETTTKLTWFGTFSTSMRDQNPTTIEMKAFLNSHPIEYTDSTGTKTRNFADMANCGKLTQEDLQITNQISTEEWQTEKKTLGQLFANIIVAYDSTKTKADGTPVQEGEEFDNFNFAALGKAFDALRNSLLLDDHSPAAERKPVEERISFNITKSMLQSKLMKNINVTNAFIDKIESNWDDPEFKFEDAFTTLGSTIKIMNAFSKNEDLSADDVTTMLEGLSGSSGSTIKDLMKEEILSTGSSSDALTQGVTDMLDALSNQDTTNMDAQKEANALNSVMNVLEKTNESESLDSITEDEANSTVDNLLESEVVFNAIVEAAGDSDNLGIESATNGNSTIEDALSNKATEISNNTELPAEEKAAQLEKLETLKGLFGLN